MKIPANAYIPIEKITNYLLTKREKNDKSKFLAQAGFTRINPESLIISIRELIAENDAYIERKTEYGIIYNVTGNLYGDHDIITVVTVWILLDSDEKYRFVTLKPVR